MVAGAIIIQANREATERSRKAVGRGHDTVRCTVAVDAVP